MNRNAESRFSHLPGVDIERSKFHRPFQHKTTFNAGELIPIFCDEVLPGDTFSMDMSSLVRMTTPIFPTMDNAYLDTYFFYVPTRLLWEHWKEFNGENSSGYWTQKVDYQIPQLLAPNSDSVLYIGRGWQCGDIADYFGIPTQTGNISVNALPFRAYVLIWNEWFRDQNSMAPAYFTKDDGNLYGVTTNDLEKDRYGVPTFDSVLVNAIYGAKPLPVSKYHDYFTSCLPEPQKGPAVDLPLYQDNIPVFADNKTHGFSSSDGYAYPMHFGSSIAPPNSILMTNNNNLIGAQFEDSNLSFAEGFDYGNLSPDNLYADVRNVAVATISQLRQAFQLQRLYEKDARGGTRYREILKVHFGVDSPDSRQQVPEYLGGKRIPINIDQVLQTSSTDNVSPQGNTAGYSMTCDIDSSFTKSFTEHGYIIGVCCVRTEHTYQQGIERMWSRKNRFDFYWPSLAHISEQAVLVKEIFATGSENDDDAFGYQEAWADYRYKPSRVSGKFRSNAVGTLDSWHYADYYFGDGDEPDNSNFVLNADWLAETKVNIDRTLAVSSRLEPQFIADFYFKLDCVRPMPLYSVPGLIDHF